MSQPLVVVFENAPEEAVPAWMAKVIADLRLTLVDTDRLHAEVVKDPKGKEAVRAHTAYAELHALQPHYAAALEKVMPGQTRLAVRGSQWLKQLPKVHGFVFDRGPVERAKKEDMAKAKAPFTPEKISQLYTVGLQAIDDMARATLTTQRVLEFAPGTPEAEKASRATTFLSALG